MDQGSVDRATATSVIVLNAAQTGASLCIPGARQEGGRVTRQTWTALEPAAGVAPARPLPDDAEQREYQRAGGGAAGERDTTRGATVFDRLLRLLR